MADDMRNIEGGIPVPPEETGNSETPQSVGPSFDLRGNFRTVPAGGPDTSPPNQYDARLGGGVTGRKPVPGSAPTQPDSGQEYHRHGLRNTIIGGGLVGTIGAVVTTAAMLLSRGGSHEQPQDPDTNSNSGVPTLVIPDKTEIPAEPSPAVIENPTLNLVSGTVYKSINELPVDEQTKQTLKELLQGSEPMIITEHVIVARENKLKTRTQCPDPFVSENVMTECGSLDTITLNTNDFPSASKNLELEGYKLKRLAWQSQNGNQEISDKEYIEMDGGDFTLWSYDGLSTKELTDVPVAKDKPQIWNYVALPEKSYIETSTGTKNSFTVKNGIVKNDIYDFDPGAINNNLTDSAKASQYTAAALAIVTGSYMSDPLIKGAKNSTFARYRVSPSYYNSKILPNAYEDKYLIPERNSDSWNSIFRATGTPQPAYRK